MNLEKVFPIDAKAQRRTNLKAIGNKNARVMYSNGQK